jgi:hypothetical protein
LTSAWRSGWLKARKREAREDREEAEEGNGFVAQTAFSCANSVCVVIPNSNGRRGVDGAARSRCAPVPKVTIYWPDVMPMSVQEMINVTQRVTKPWTQA